MILLKNCEKTKILIPAKISSLKVVPKLYEKNFDFKVPGTFCLIRGKLLNAKNNNKISSALLFAHFENESFNEKNYVSCNHASS